MAINTIHYYYIKDESGYYWVDSLQLLSVKQLNIKYTLIANMKGRSKFNDERFHKI